MDSFELFDPANLHMAVNLSDNNPAGMVFPGLVQDDTPLVDLAHFDHDRHFHEEEEEEEEETPSTTPSSPVESSPLEPSPCSAQNPVSVSTCINQDGGPVFRLSVDAAAIASAIAASAGLERPAKRARPSSPGSPASSGLSSSPSSPSASSSTPAGASSIAQLDLVALLASLQRQSRQPSANPPSSASSSPASRAASPPRKPSKPELSPEDKAVQRRERNKAIAKRSRQKKKLYLQGLEQRVKEMENAHAEHVRVIGALANQNQALRGVVAGLQARLGALKDQERY